MQIHGQILVLRLISYAQTARECRQTSFFSQIQIFTRTIVTYEWATQFLLSDVLHCTNMNTDFIDFSNIVTII